MSQSVVSALVAAACRSCLKAWAVGYAWYLDKYDVEKEGIELHESQEKVVEIQEWCEEHNIPCRICKVKPRRGGSSTIAVASMYHALMKRARRGCIMAGRPFQLFSLFKMLKLMGKKDRIATQRIEVLTEVARFPNGSEVVAVNAASESSAVSAGFTFLIVTELSKWAQEGVAAAAPVLSAALKCVPFLPGTTIIIESTAEGVGDEFHRIYSTGITFDELKAGKVGYVKVFAPWFAFKDAVLEPTTMGINSVADLTADEVELSARYQLSLPQIAWMRYTIHDQCHDSFEEFKRDYPFNDVECFLLSGAKVFSAPALKKMRDMLPMYPPIAGVIDIKEPKLAEKADPASVIFRPTTASEARLVLIEYPTEGMKYVLGLDTMTGASAATGENPDNHGAVVWRAGFMHQGSWKPPRAVAMLVGDWELYLSKRKYVFIWDPDVLTEQVWRLMLYYGNCLLAGEINSDRGTLMAIHQRGGNVYFQKQWNKREQKETNSLGWKTDEASRRHLLAELGKGIREFNNFDPLKGHSKERVEIFLAPILDEADVFIRKNDGREEAMEGKHDDCFVAGTKILTPSGQRPIETLRVGDLVVTRDGPRPIINTRSKIKAVIENVGLIGTPDHPIITPSGEIGLSSVDDKTTLYIWNPLNQRVEKRSFTEARTIIGIPTLSGDSFEFTSGVTTNGKSRLLLFTGKCGSMRTEPYRTGMLSIIAMEILSTMTLRTLSYWSAANIPRFMRLALSGAPSPEPMDIAKPLELRQPSKSGAMTTPARHSVLGGKTLNSYLYPSASSFANAAPPLLYPKSEVKNIALVAAIFGSKTERRLPKRRVYNLQVTDTPEYFANNILVHNCIMAAGIALSCMDQATTYHRPQGAWDEPEWMRNASGNGAEKSQYA